MMNFHVFKIAVTAAYILAFIVFFTGIPPAASGVKTSLKKYSIITHENQAVLCEPYTVKKDDWLYKIFRQKGEISEQDFPLFISIFKTINPGISNIDTISPGVQILIPLKIDNRQAYMPDDTGMVAVPVVEFSNMPGQESLKKRALSPRDAATARRPDAFLQDVSPYKIQQLKRYAALINGTLQHQGKMFFPAKNGDTIVQLDLSQTPLVRNSDTGERTLLLPENRTSHDLETLIQTIKSHWRHIKTAQIRAAIQKARQHAQKTVSLDVVENSIARILANTPFSYVSAEKIPFLVNNISMSGEFGRVKRPDRSDLLINFANVYGNAITRVKNMGFDILSFSPNQPWKDQIRLLLSALGYSIWENPSFSHNKTVETLEGLYAELLPDHVPDRVFVSLYPLSPGAVIFLQTEQIRYIQLK